MHKVCRLKWQGRETHLAGRLQASASGLMLVLARIHTCRQWLKDHQFGCFETIEEKSRMLRMVAHFTL